MSLQVKRRYPVPRPSRPSHNTLPQRTLKREQRKKTLRRTTTTMLTLLILAIGAGLVYTWYIGQHRVVSATPAAPSRSVRPMFHPHKVASDAPIGVATQTFTSDAKVGTNASISIRTNPEAECSISVKYNNIAASDSGLATKVTDEFGTASWAWTVAASAPVGKWPVVVTCKNKKNSAVVAVDITVTR